MPDRIPQDRSPSIRNALRQTAARCLLGATTLVLPMLCGAANTPAVAQQQQQRPNILFIMGDDIGWMQPSIYHRGLMVGETPNIDRIGK